VAEKLIERIERTLPYLIAAILLVIVADVLLLALELLALLARG